MPTATIEHSPLADFHRAIRGDAARMHKAARHDDLATIGFLAHRAKGMSLMFGAVELAEACSLVAMACRAGELAAMRSALAAFDGKAQSAAQTLMPPAQPVVDAPAPLCAGLKFLVVEDHEFQRRLVVSFLRRLGALQVVSFGDGAPALAAMTAMTDAAQAVDIAILDMSMPDMDGIALMRRLSGAPHPFSIIINSALSPSLLASMLQTASRLRVHLLGAVNKPMTEANLAPLIARHRSRMQGASEDLA